MRWLHTVVPASADSRRQAEHYSTRQSAQEGLGRVFAVSAGTNNGQLDCDALRGCLKSPNSVKFGDYTRSFQLPNTWAESYARTVSVEISGLFKHPLTTYSVSDFKSFKARCPLRLVQFERLRPWLILRR